MESLLQQSCETVREALRVSCMGISHSQASLFSATSSSPKPLLKCSNHYMTPVVWILITQIWKILSKCAHPSRIWGGYLPCNFISYESKKKSFFLFKQTFLMRTRVMTSNSSLSEVKPEGLHVRDLNSNKRC